MKHTTVLTIYSIFFHACDYTAEEDFQYNVPVHKSYSVENSFIKHKIKCSFLHNLLHISISVYCLLHSWSGLIMTVTGSSYLIFGTVRIPIVIGLTYTRLGRNSSVRSNLLNICPEEYSAKFIVTVFIVLLELSLSKLTLISELLNYYFLSEWNKTVTAYEMFKPTN